VIFNILQKLSLRQFILTSFFIKVTYTFLVLMLGFNLFKPIIGDFGYPGYLAISRLFEFCLGIAMAKVYASNPNLLIT
jgi:hypothetical protein